MSAIGATGSVSANGTGLNFGVTWLLPSSTDGRAFGFLLRCLSE
ncbi:hypothetical protein [uncultured Rikenella sp.]|nr:hypothetical protein [uncultured Rikenella sp.]